MSSGTETVEMRREQADKLLANFVRGDELRVIPARRNAKLVVFDWLAARFEDGRRYTEPEVNALLARSHADVATLRRGLYDEHFVDRDLGVYWRTAQDQRLRLI